MKRKLSVAAIALGCVWIATPLLDPDVVRAETAPPDGTVNETRPAKSDGVVDIDVPNGSVKVVAWNKAEVNVTGHVERAQLDVTTSADRTQVRVSNDRLPITDWIRARGGEAEIEVRVPRGSRIEAKGASMQLEVRDVSGPLRLQSASGDISVSASSTDVDVHSVSGNVEIKVQGAGVNARTVSGDVRVTGARGRAAVESVSGDCVLEGTNFSEVEMRAVSGNLLLMGGITAQGTVELKSHSGNVGFQLPGATNADFELRSFSGSLQANLGDGRSQQSRSKLDLRTGSGGAKVRGATFSGDVRLDVKGNEKK